MSAGGVVQRGMDAEAWQAVAGALAVLVAVSSAETPTAAVSTRTTAKIVTDTYLLTMRILFSCIN